jgi:hypothetical protein
MCFDRGGCDKACDLNAYSRGTHRDVSPWMDRFRWGIDLEAREDGRKIHDMHLFEVKAPEECRDH